MSRSKKAQLKIALIVPILLFFNRILGEFLGYVGKCEVVDDFEKKVKIYFNCKGFTNRLITKTLKANAFTLDSIILTNNSRLSENTYAHELAHVQQYSYLGPLFYLFTVSRTLTL